MVVTLGASSLEVVSLDSIHTNRLVSSAVPTQYDP